MTTKPEANFVKRIHSKLNKNLYKQAMGLTVTNGTPDYYYEGKLNYLWVEYKWYPTEPTFVDLYNTARKPSLSMLQQHWLKRAHTNNINTAVVAGYPKGCIILQGLEWETPWNNSALEDHIYEESAWIDYLNELESSV